MKATAIYERVSTGRQDFASQHGDLETYAAGLSGDVVWFRDRFTGRSLDRPAFSRMIDQAYAGRIGRIVVWRLDRLGRTAKGLVGLFEELVELKVDLVSLRDGINLRTVAGRLMANVLASVAAFETEVRGERIRAGIEAKRARGERWHNGRPKGTADKLTPAVVDTIGRMRGDKVPVAHIARQLRISRQSVYNALRAERPGDVR
jgi:DNA invertase Pin-like site-specific DNA recombinase